MSERTVVAFQVETLHSLLTAAHAVEGMIREFGKEPVDIRLELDSIRSGYNWLKLIEDRRPNITRYYVRLERADA